MTATDYYWFAKWQYYSLLAVGFTSSGLSVFGSTIIVSLVFRRTKVLTDPSEIYHRIILGLSCMDILISMGIFLSPFLNRADTGLPMAIGNIASCDFAGALSTFFLGSSLYNCLLGLYYACTVRGGIPNWALSEQFEPWIHLFAFTIPLAHAIGMVATTSVNPNIMLGVCAFESYPWNCAWEDEIECERSTLATLIIGRVHLYLTLISTIVGIIATWLVYWTVRQTKSRWSANDDTHLQQTRQVAWQAIWYMATFVNGFGWAFFAMVMKGVYVSGQTIESFRHSNALYGATMLMYFFFPLQGFFNFMVYVQPRLRRWKEWDPEQTYWWAFQQVVSARPAPTGVRSSAAKTQTDPSDSNAGTNHEDICSSTDAKSREIVRSSIQPNDLDMSRRNSLGMRDSMRHSRTISANDVPLSVRQSQKRQSRRESLNLFIGTDQDEELSLYDEYDNDEESSSSPKPFMESLRNLGKPSFVKPRLKDAVINEADEPADS